MLRYRDFRRSWDRRVRSVRDRLPAGWMPRRIGGPYEYPPSMVWFSLKTFFAHANEYLSGPALLLLPGVGILLAFTALSQLSPARNIALLLLLIILCDGAAGWVFRPNVRAERKMPPSVRSGSEFSVLYRLENRRGLPAFDLELDPGIGLRYFQFSRRAELPELPGHGSADLELRLLAPRRGCYAIGKIRVISSFPFGLFRRGRRIGAGTGVRVYPAFVPLAKLVLPNGRKFQNSGLNRISKISEAADFRGCRDFRAGDNPRHLHWSASARHGKLIVKEFQEEYLNRVALLLDTAVPKFRLGRSRGPQAVLEAELSLAAAAAEFLLGGESLIDLFVAGREIRHLQSGRGTAPLEAVFDLLAEVEPEEENSLLELSGAVVPELRSIGGALVFLLSAGEEQQNYVASLERGGCAVKCVVIAHRKPDLLPERWLFLTPDAIFQGKVTEL